MHPCSRVLACFGITALSVMCLAIPAQAADSADTTVTVAVTGSGLSIRASAQTMQFVTLQPGSAAQANIFNGVTVPNAYARTSVTVTDARTTTGGSYHAGVRFADLIGRGGNVLPASQFAIKTNTPQYTGANSNNATVQPAGQPDGGHNPATASYVTFLTAGTSPLVDVSNTTGTNTLTLEERFYVNVPPTATADIYTGTLTHYVI